MEVLRDAVIIGDLGSDNTVSVFVSAEGTSGPTVSVNKAALLSALTIDAGDLATGQAYQTKGTGNDVLFAAADNSEAMRLICYISGCFYPGFGEHCNLRADNGGTMSRLRFASDNIATTKTNMEAANGRIIDVDVAAESTRLAKYNVLIQASASMLAQANTNNDIALMLLR